MTGAETLDFAREALWVTVQLCAPVMMIALVIGLAIAFLQALTQIQEMTIVFVPKILAIFAALVLLLPFMGQIMAAFMADVSARIIAGSG